MIENLIVQFSWFLYLDSVESFALFLTQACTELSIVVSFPDKLAFVSIISDLTSSATVRPILLLKK